ncbi:MAG: transcription-repair coupling factor, partial [Clostridia bacterium]|nr:transcription-repair coupling factor [Clostridia bacterium]
DLAQDLLKLYAARHSLRGFAFAPDTPWQKEFEDAFTYEETEDQLKCIEEVKRDMEKPRPMDRLLCGDVGYGKTEVALRAACKAAFNGKQTAVLVPTTILAEQHYNTFLERFKGFPIKVNVLSRFRSSKEQKEIVQALAQGEIDIIIGTHRLLSQDIKFKDLGLLVVDEEQRFGVLHKEKLKKLKKTVDVLTLTATPIPRTLQMSLVGVRDMSVIETPPEERYPVQTFVVEYSPQLVKEALKREIGRGGQVYFVHNRVEDIEKVALEIQGFVPEARVGIAHGQMTEMQLENIMLDFWEGHLDILVCTTIIESGLDIANVNTLIVDQADKLGLSQLYQLRGRVGRSNRVAYAYLTYQKDKVLSEIAEKRLSAIREFTELGSGFKIAMRDLEIRGAGNILGAEQSGQIAAVGFDLYCQLLEQAVREAKGEEQPPEKTVLIDIHLKAYIPQEYISDNGVKINFYQRINAVKEEEELRQLAEELKDRFGPLPEPVINLLQIAQIQLAAVSSKISSIIQEENTIKIKLEDDHGLTGRELMELVRRYRRKVSFSVSTGLEIKVNVGNLQPKQRLVFLEEIISEISSLALGKKILI